MSGRRVVYTEHSLPPGHVADQIRFIRIVARVKEREAARLNFLLWLLARGRVDPDGAEERLTFDQEGEAWNRPG